ncbi:MAG: hypothetical protein J6B81_04970 [Spirochaetaceae bacterium]|nr:hypothetical protein [Spirochaetaceae bacterium]
MNKKILVVAMVMIVACATGVFALGIGVQGGTTIGGGPGAAVTFKLDSAPWVFAVDVGGFGGTLSVGATADMWIGNPSFNSVFGWFYGWGIAGSVAIGDDLGLAAGPRLLIGANATLVDDFIELYVQAAWQPMVVILPDFGFDLVSFPISGGIRFWF